MSTQSSDDIIRELKKKGIRPPMDLSVREGGALSDEELENAKEGLRQRAAKLKKL